MDIGQINNYGDLRTLEQAQQETGSDELGQDDFLTLMLAQLENQDPTNPVDNVEFLSQIAQFSQVRGIQELQSSFANFSDQFSTQMALDAASMIGSEAILATDFLQLSEGQIARASIDVPEGVDSVEISVRDQVGNLVDRFAVDIEGAGIRSFEWDGTSSGGEQMPEGVYNFSALVRGETKDTALSLYVHEQVDSVLLDQTGAGMVLGTSGGREVGMADIVGFIDK
jgi:flagellar basal-body rod modification protein FlgD